jgi:hypothetical protein
VKKAIIFVTCLLFVGVTPNANSATIKEGSKCKKENAVTKSGTLNFICLKSGKSLVLVQKFKKCVDAIASNRAPIIQALDPMLYLANSGLDRDKDGTACDQ